MLSGPTPPPLVQCFRSFLCHSLDLSACKCCDVISSYHHTVCCCSSHCHNPRFHLAGRMMRKGANVQRHNDLTADVQQRIFHSHTHTHTHTHTDALSWQCNRTAFNWKPKQQGQSRNKEDTVCGRQSTYSTALMRYTCTGCRSWSSRHTLV